MKGEKVDGKTIEELTKPLIQAWVHKREEVIDFICRNMVKPPIKGEITAGKIKHRGLEVKLFDNGRVFYMEQRGVKVSPVFDVKTWKVDENLDPSKSTPMDKIIKDAIKNEQDALDPMKQVRIGGKVKAKKRMKYSRPRNSSRQAPIVNMNPTPGNNDICACGSGKKYKNCHKNRKK